VLGTARDPIKMARDEDSREPDLEAGPARARYGGKHVPTLMGIFIALVAVAAYFLFFLKPPPPSGPPAVANLSTVEGSVRVKPVGRNDWAKGQARRGLRTGDVVQTDARSGAEITFVTTGNVVRVRPDSVVLVTAEEAAEAGEATSWHVQAGQVNFELKKDTEIVTASARTRATANSTGNINVTEEGGTGVKIFQGSAQVATKQGETINLTENQAVLVDAQGKAGARIELPPAPKLVGPPARAELEYVSAPQATAKLQWEVVRSAQTYRVSMDYNVQQADLLLSAALDEPGIAATVHDLKGLDPGKYFWRVAGVTKEGIDGDFSKVSLFSVVKPPQPEPSTGFPLTFEAAAVLEGILHVKGRTEPGASVTVDGREVKVLPDGSFSEFVKRTENESVVVRATSASGQFAERTRAVAAN
jgi:hypothetical protein